MADSMETQGLRALLARALDHHPLRLRQMRPADVEHHWGVVDALTKKILDRGVRPISGLAMFEGDAA